MTLKQAGAAAGALVAIAGLIGLVVAYGHRWLTVEEAVPIVASIAEKIPAIEKRVDGHDEIIKQQAAINAQQADILNELKEATLKEKAVRAARNEICRSLRLAGKIEKGDCPKLDEDDSR